MLPLRSSEISRTINIVNQCFSLGGKAVRNQIPNVMVQRSFHATRKMYSFWEYSRRGGSAYEKEDPMTKMEHFRRGAKMILPETKKWLGEMKDYLAQDAQKHLYPEEGVVDKYFEFNGPDSLDNWVVSCDSDWDGGFTTADVTISPSGSGIFSGNLCTKTPKTGKVHVSGYANLKFVPPRRSFQREHTYVFVAYTHLALRVRGDGRTYMINLHPHTMFDFQWMDLHSYVLHTRGGPYWQETTIPFSKFFLHHKGRIHDDQYALDLQEIKNFSITIMDQNEGPFNLEIDYVGCVMDGNHNETFVYEQYYVPRFTGKN